MDKGACHSFVRSIGANRKGHFRFNLSFLLFMYTFDFVVEQYSYDRSSIIMKP